MKWTILDGPDYQVSAWSGGTTRQLYLFPPDGHYGRREFDYRLSTATVELAESRFSDLSGFQRILMTLDRPIQLINASRQEEIDLPPFTPYAFEGSDAVTSRGTCQDFNLIYQEPYQGQMKALRQEDSQIRQKAQTQFVYALTDLDLDLAGQTLHLAANQLLVIQQQGQKELSIGLSPQQPSASSIVAIWAGIQKKDC